MCKTIYTAPEVRILLLSTTAVLQSTSPAAPAAPKLTPGNLPTNTSTPPGSVTII